ncbi:hypothetical protein KIN20_033264 [Parelaphostrongylus tenuis]|uniref:Uncharacterized protein n=1 Tax=Parelaphostrongylus tenuis TaxID=148309 RepID=A0AAD5WI41_PARTN|nr:hypothetical protein KIN20_033264 [Parelaphostrongylus tenuis]
MASFPADHQKSQRSVAPRLPAYLLSSRSLDIPYDSPMATVSFTSQRDSSPNSCRKDANRKKKTRPLKEDSTGGIPTRGEVLLQNSLNESSLPYTVSNRAVNYEQAYFPPSWYNYRHISACSSASAKTCCSSNFDQKLENLAQPLSIAVPSDTHSDGYATGSASHSWGNSDATSDPLKLFFSDGSGNFELNGSPVNDLPPPAYADSPQPPERYSDGDQDVSHIQHINETVSDFFSQSASCSDSSEESSPEKCEQKFSREDNLEDELVLEKTQNSLARITPAEGNGGGAPLAFQKYSVTSSVSSTRSPIAKRGRFVSKDTNIVASLAVSYKRLLNFQRYSNEFAKDTYMWLSHQELNVHAIDPKFMFAQKSSGTSFEDRRLVLLKATSEMKKRKHSMEAIHLGAYILDKCLDSFHISKEALADVCAVSMVLGTKMEEYDSLQPGTVNGLVGASSDKNTSL